MHAGRKPKPTHLHAVEGTYNSTRHKDRAEEPQPTGTPIIPKSVRGKALTIWNETVKAAPWLTEANSRLLAVWCKLAVELDTGNLKNVVASRITAFRTLGSELGLSKINMSYGSNNPEDPADKYLD